MSKLTKNQKIEILQEENARLRKELERVNYLTTDGITVYVDEQGKASRQLLIELTELREDYKKKFTEANKLLEELREIAKIEGVKKRRFLFKR